MKTTEQAIQYWKENNIAKCDMEFNCGGDQMNDYTFNYYDSEGNEVEKAGEELDDYFDENVYKNVEFYVNSDGHYMGEAGNVYITLEDDSEDFSYEKVAESEWNETFTEEGLFPLTEKEKTFLTEKIESILGGEDGEGINYKADTILTDEECEMVDDLQERIRDFACDYPFNNAEGEASDWYRYSTNENGDDDGEMVIEGDNLKVHIERTFYIYTPSEN